MHAAHTTAEDYETWGAFLQGYRRLRSLYGKNIRMSFTHANDRIYPFVHWRLNHHNEPLINASPCRASDHATASLQRTVDHPAPGRAADRIADGAYADGFHRHRDDGQAWASVLGGRWIGRCQL